MWYKATELFLGSMKVSNSLFKQFVIIISDSKRTVI